MINRIIYTLLIVITVKNTTAQKPFIDSLLTELRATKNDTARLILYSALTENYRETNSDSALFYAEKALESSRKLHLKLEEIFALSEKGYAYLNLGNYSRSLQTFLSAITIAENPKTEQLVLPPNYPPPDDFTDRNKIPFHQRLDKLGRIHQYMGILYSNNNNFEKALAHHTKARQLAEQTGNLRISSIINIPLGRVYLALNKPDSALLAAQQAYDQAMQIGYRRYLGSIFLNLGRIHDAQGHTLLAIDYFKKALNASREFKYYRGVVASNLLLADYYRKSGKTDSSLTFIKNALPVAQYLNAPELLLRCYTALTNYYKTQNNNDSTVKYQSLIIALNNNMINSKQAQQFQNIDFDEQQRQQQIETANSEYRAKMKMYFLLAGLALFLFIAIIFWRNSKQRKKANAILTLQKAELELAISNLKKTQAQLIQSEKMASLGELTAGIAHEIQNPLNFVNNFSEVNTELIEELNAERQKMEGERNKQLENGLLNDIAKNLEKINYHGKRADAIVKGMLQHSRSSSGQKEQVDLNNLVSEYLRLAYHGLRAKDKTFNATIKTDFDESIGNINIIPQDIGRVILNLITNAFYAAPLPPEAGFKDPHYKHEPTVWVSTKKVGDKVLISVRDNGPGIPQNIVDKIFQPFFTTKPTGQGTGLGLSLSYDIVNAHGGEIKVETKESEGSEFIIQLPIT